MKGLRLEQPSLLESNQLRQENDKLRKEIILLEGELRKSQQRDFPESRSVHSPFLHQDSQQTSSLAPSKSREEGLRKQADSKEREVQRISDLLKKICEFSEIYDFLELVEKDSKYRYILASIGSTGYEVPPKQRQEIEQNLQTNEKKLSAVEKDIVRKMGDLLETSPQNEEMTR
jgi:cell division protein FtsB